MLPPKLVRRLVLAPLDVIIAIALAVLFPLLALLAVAVSLVSKSNPGHKRRGLRLLYFTLIWLTAETAALFMCLGLWVTSGFGGRLNTEPYQARHYAVMEWFVNLVYRAATGTFGITVEVEEPELTEDEEAARLARPVIVLSRHAGPGDSFLLVHHLLTVYKRRPRIVMKDTMQLDPGVDVILNRLPNVFISRRRGGASVYTDLIERLAGGLDATGALVIFPEGGNWTPGRWQKAIQRLEKLGRRDLAARARLMPNVLPPRGGGALSAIAACPEADVIFVAHAGLDLLVSVGDVWRSLPMDQLIRVKWWRVPFDMVPRDAGEEIQLRWLYDWWELIDSWITDNRPADAQGTPAAEALAAAEPVSAEEPVSAAEPASAPVVQGQRPTAEHSPDSEGAAGVGN